MKVCHLVLKYKYYDLIESGEKLIEYRRNIDYYRKRVLDATHVTFHRGYTNRTMTFEINFKVLLREQIEIHLGKKVS